MIGVWEGGAELSEAESNIIAFALNAVASAATLIAVPREVASLALAWRHVDVYDGPTEGVAPHG